MEGKAEVQEKVVGLEVEAAAPAQEDVAEAAMAAAVRAYTLQPSEARRVALRPACRRIQSRRMPTCRLRRPRRRCACVCGSGCRTQSRSA